MTRVYAFSSLRNFMLGEDPKEMSKCFLNSVEYVLKYKMLDMRHCIILYNVLYRQETRMR
jgi:hypothetical protein